jgi:hypothetical protein
MAMRRLVATNNCSTWRKKLAKLWIEKEDRKEELKSNREELTAERAQLSSTLSQTVGANTIDQQKAVSESLNAVLEALLLVDFRAAASTTLIVLERLANDSTSICPRGMVQDEGLNLGLIDLASS